MWFNCGITGAGMNTGVCEAQMNRALTRDLRETSRKSASKWLQQHRHTKLFPLHPDPQKDKMLPLIFIWEHFVWS